MIVSLARRPLRRTFLFVYDISCSGRFVIILTPGNICFPDIYLWTVPSIHGHLLFAVRFYYKVQKGGHWWAVARVPGFKLQVPSHGDSPPPDLPPRGGGIYVKSLWSRLLSLFVTPTKVFLCGTLRPPACPACPEHGRRATPCVKGSCRFP